MCSSSLSRVGFFSAETLVMNMHACHSLIERIHEVVLDVFQIPDIAAQLLCLFILRKNRMP